VTSWIEEVHALHAHDPWTARRSRDRRRIRRRRLLADDEVACISAIDADALELSRAHEADENETSPRSISSEERSQRPEAIVMAATRRANLADQASAPIDRPPQRPAPRPGEAMKPGVSL